MEDKLELFDESNIILEEALGMILDSFGIYRQNDIEDPTQAIIDIQEFDDMNDILCSTVENPDMMISDITTEDKISTIIESLRGLDEFGHSIIKKQRCPVCGKEVNFMLPNGFCSIECFTKDLMSKITLGGQGQYSDEVGNIIDKVQDILSMLSTTLNVVAKLPDLLANLSKIPIEYREYATVRINIGYVNLKIVINKLMMKKNDLLIKLLKRIKFGVIDEKLQPLFGTIQQIINVVQKLKESLDIATQSIIKIIENPIYAIPPQSYGFFLTPKSIQYPLTTGKILIQIPFDTTQPTSLGFPTQIPAGFGASCFNNMNYELIDKIIHSIFLPITEVEYLLDPEVFKVRLALSDQNAPLIKNVIQQLETLCVMGADYLPRYQRLSLTNVWFIIAILMGWGPVSRQIFGDYWLHGYL